MGEGIRQVSRGSSQASFTPPGGAAQAHVPAPVSTYRSTRSFEKGPPAPGLHQWQVEMDSKGRHGSVKRSREPAPEGDFTGDDKAAHSHGPLKSAKSVATPQVHAAPAGASSGAAHRARESQLWKAQRDFLQLLENRLLRDGLGTPEAHDYQAARSVYEACAATPALASDLVSCVLEWLPAVPEEDRARICHKLGVEMVKHLLGDKPSPQALEALLLRIPIGHRGSRTLDAAALGAFLRGVLALLTAEDPVDQYDPDFNMGKSGSSAYSASLAKFLAQGAWDLGPPEQLEHAVLGLLGSGSGSGDSSEHGAAIVSGVLRLYEKGLSPTSLEAACRSLSSLGGRAHAWLRAIEGSDLDEARKEAFYVVLRRHADDGSRPDHDNVLADMAYRGWLKANAMAGRRAVQLRLLWTPGQSEPEEGVSGLAVTLATMIERAPTSAAIAQAGATMKAVAPSCWRPTFEALAGSILGRNWRRAHEDEFPQSMFAFYQGFTGDAAASTEGFAKALLATDPLAQGGCASVRNFARTLFVVQRTREEDPMSWADLTRMLLDWVKAGDPQTVGAAVMGAVQASGLVEMDEAQRAPLLEQLAKLASDHGEPLATRVLQAARWAMHPQTIVSTDSLSITQTRELVGLALDFSPMLSVKAARQLVKDLVALPGRLPMRAEFLAALACATPSRLTVQHFHAIHAVLVDYMAQLVAAGAKPQVLDHPLTLMGRLYTRFFEDGRLLAKDQILTKAQLGGEAPWRAWWFGQRKQEVGRWVAIETQRIHKALLPGPARDRLLALLQQKRSDYGRKCLGEGDPAPGPQAGSSAPASSTASSGSSKPSCGD